MRRLFITICAITFTAPLVSAQEVDDRIMLENATVLSPRIDVILSRQNRNIEVISASEIQKMPAKNLNEILLNQSGIDVQQKGPNGVQADISINGGSFDQTLILLNGMRMSDVQTGHNMMNLPINIFAIERIEILKGPAAAIYGINALNGVINIVTKTGIKDVFLASVISGTNFITNDSTDNMYYDLLADVYLTKKLGSSQHSVGSGFASGNGYRYNTSFNNFKVYYSGNFDLAGNKNLFIQSGYTTNSFGANGFYAAPFDSFSIEKVKVFTTSAKMIIPLKEKWFLLPSVHYRYGYDFYVLNKYNKAPNAYKNTHNTHALDVNLDTRYMLGKHTIGMGISNRLESIHSSNLGERMRNNIGAFVNFKSAIGNRFDYMLGSFFNYNSVFGFKIYPSIDLGYYITHDAKIYANMGTGQRIPTFTDLYYSDRINVGNENLQPEFAITYELGYKQKFKYGFFNLSGFYRNGLDYIDWFRADSLSKWKPYNLAKVNTLGLNVNTKIDIFKSSKIQLKYNLGYTYLSPKYENNDGQNINNLISRYVINSLSHQINNGLNFWHENGISLSLQHRYAVRMNTPKMGANDFRRGTYSILDCRIGYNFNMFTIFADIRNMLDIKYIESGVVPMPGRWISVGIRKN